MKLKYLLTGLLISLLSISFSSAWDELILPGNGYDLGNSNNCSVNSDLSFSCSVSNNVFQNVGTPAWGNYSTSYWWNNDGLGFYQYSSSNSSCNIQGVITGFTFCEYDFVGNNSLRINNSMYWSNCFSKTYTYDEFSSYVSSHQLRYWSPVSFSTSNGYAGLVFVFDEGAFRTQFDVGSYCTNFMYGNYGIQDFGLVGLTPDFSNLNIINSPANKSPQYYYSTGSCPSVGQLKANSKLIPAVCYGGYGSDVIYTAGESTPFVGGSGLDVFQIYNLTSGGMQLQTWYDTYWVYYNHISSDPSPFYNKPKALLGLQLARQLGSMSGIKGSSSILNYCYYVVNDIPDNTSTCVGSNVSTVYSGFTFTDLDREDTLESIIGWENSVRIQSGFDTGDLTDIYNQSYSLFSSRTVDPGFNGIIPSYIVIGFLGIVLLYFLRR